VGHLVVVWRHEESAALILASHGECCSTSGTFALCVHSRINIRVMLCASDCRLESFYIQTIPFLSCDVLTKEQPVCCVGVNVPRQDRVPKVLRASSFAIHRNTLPSAARRSALNFTEAQSVRPVIHFSRRRLSRVSGHDLSKEPVSDSFPCQVTPCGLEISLGL
jgi:hypothetical protein